MDWNPPNETPPDEPLLLLYNFKIAESTGWGYETTNSNILGIKMGKFIKEEREGTPWQIWDVMSLSGEEPTAELQVRTLWAPTPLAWSPLSQMNLKFPGWDFLLKQEFGGLLRKYSSQASPYELLETLDSIEVQL